MGSHIINTFVNMYLKKQLTLSWNMNYIVYRLEKKAVVCVGDHRCSVASGREEWR